jgi:hypothetical protein
MPRPSHSLQLPNSCGDHPINWLCKQGASSLATSGRFNSYGQKLLFCVWSDRLNRKVSGSGAQWASGCTECGGSSQPRRDTTPKALAQQAWKESDLPSWLNENEKVYTEQIQPRLAGIASSALASAIGVSRQYAINIRAGRRRPHPPHWLTLARIVEVSQDDGGKPQK